MTAVKSGDLRGSYGHGAADLLKESAPDTKVHQNRRFVDNGRITTAAGVSAGIDGALHVVVKLHGQKLAQETAEYMEYR